MASRTQATRIWAIRRMNSPANRPIPPKKREDFMTSVGRFCGRKSSSGRADLDLQEASWDGGLQIDRSIRMTERRVAYPETEPFRSGKLDVGDGHVLHFEECGNPHGKPVVMIHGGPGGGSNTFMRRLHDPSHYRIVLFDQRGAGKSTPAASLEANTTGHLIADMEKLRGHLGIERWQLCGGSWGSTLALAYAQSHPLKVSELILRGIFTLRRWELEWFYQEGASRIFPDAWQNYVAPIPREERGDMIAAYYRRLTGDDPAERLRCARAWSQWEGATISLLPDPARVARFGTDQFALTF